MQSDKLIVGRVYEVVPVVVFGSNPYVYFAKLIGFSSEDRPVFERNGNYFHVDTQQIIKEIGDEK